MPGRHGPTLGEILTSAQETTALNFTGVAAPTRYDIVPASISATTFTIQQGGETLLTVRRRGGGFEVSAPSLEAADEAGRVFVNSMRHELLSLGVTR